MKVKYFAACLLVLILAAGISVVSATDVDYDDGHSFTMPDGYEIVEGKNTTEDIIMEKNGDNRIVFQYWIDNYDDLKEVQENYNFADIIKAVMEDAVIGDEENYTFEDFDVTQLDYKVDGIQCYSYILDNGKEGYVIHHIAKEDLKDLNDPDNIIGDLVKSIK